LKDCCDAWWNRLTDTQKEWIHYYFYDIETRLQKVLLDELGDSTIHKQHEFRFTTEGNPR